MSVQRLQALASCKCTPDLPLLFCTKRLGVAEMAAGPYRDNYVLVFVRERPHSMGGGLEVAQLVAPPQATKCVLVLAASVETTVSVALRRWSQLLSSRTLTTL